MTAPACFSRPSQYLQTRRRQHIPCAARIHLLLLAFALLILLGSPKLRAQSLLTSLTCQPASGPDVVLSVYTLDLSDLGTPYHYLDLVTSLGDVVAEATAAYSGTSYPTCSLYTPSGPIVFTGVTFSEFSAYGSGPSVAFDFFTDRVRPNDSNPLLLAETLLSYTGGTGPAPGYSSQPSIGSVSCGSLGSVPVYSYSIVYDTDGYFTLGLDPGALQQLEAAILTNTVYPSCTLTTDVSVALKGVRLVYVSLEGYGAGIYSNGSLVYASVVGESSSLSVSGNPTYGASLATLTCAAPTGVASLAIPLYSLDIGGGRGSINSAISAYSALQAADKHATTYPSCTIATGSSSIALANVVFSDSALSGDGGVDATMNGLNAAMSNVYSGAELTFTAITSGGVTVTFPSDVAAPRAVALLQ